uniref:6-phosphogluconolactonase n=1 Tax=Albugo laibachii Nc14 TaxID=890382 RepID=F0WSE4_9STRA|nr:6phosphogluconolactonase putative [Albugo laibachii Nc14]|eukprot:CCA24264.1 6phosphogluconolactonase putative [Albugo laibachii Nc14]
MGENDTMKHARHTRLVKSSSASAKVSCNSFSSIRMHNTEKSKSRKAHAQSDFETPPPQHHKFTPPLPLCVPKPVYISMGSQNSRVSQLCSCISMQQEEIYTLRQSLRESRFELLRSEIEYQELFQERQLIQIENDSLSTDVERLTMELGDRGEQVRKLLEKRNQFKAKYKHSEREKEVSEQRICDYRAESDRLLQEVQKARDARDRMQHLYYQLKEAAGSPPAPQFSLQLAKEPEVESMLADWKRIYRRRVQKVAVGALVGMQALRKALSSIRAPVFVLQKEMMSLTAALHRPMMSFAMRVQQAESNNAKVACLEDSLRTSEIARCHLQEDLWSSRNNVLLVCQLCSPNTTSDLTAGKEVVSLEENTCDSISIDQRNREVILRDHTRSRESDGCSMLKIRLDCIHSDTLGMEGNELFHPLLQSLLNGHNGFCLLIDTTLTSGSYESSLKVLKAAYHIGALWSTEDRICQFRLHVSFVAVSGSNLCDLLSSNMSFLPAKDDQGPLTFVETDFDGASDLIVNRASRLNAETGLPMRPSHRILTVKVSFDKGSAAYASELQILQLATTPHDVGDLFEVLRDARISEEKERCPNSALSCLVRNTTRPKDKLLLVMKVPATSTQSPLVIDPNTYSMLKSIQSIRGMHQRQHASPTVSPEITRTLSKNATPSDAQHAIIHRSRPEASSPPIESTQHSANAKQRLSERPSVKVSAQLKSSMKHKGDIKMGELPRLPPKLLLESPFASRMPSPLTNHVNLALPVSKERPTQGDKVGKAVGALVEKVSSSAIQTNGRFTIAISGGSLPKILQNGLGAIASAQIDFTKWHVFFADERCVALDHADSNYRACHEAFFSQVSIPRDQIYTIDPIDDSGEAAKAYEDQLRNVFGEPDVPAFDLVLLGLGPDGHTCSLFPGHPLLSERTKWVASIQDSPKPPSERITLTLPVVNNARHVAFVVTGANKADTVKSIVQNVKEAENLPAGMIRLSQGEVQWYLDAAAGSRL